MVDINSASKASSAAWRVHADALAVWAQRLLVNRTDVWGGYNPLELRGQEYTRRDGTTGKYGNSTTRPAPSMRGTIELTSEVIARHFRGERHEHIIGLHSTSPNNMSRWGAIDIDKHGNTGNAEANRLCALTWYVKLVDLGLAPLLTDSNGAGGFHLTVVFREPVVTPQVFAFLNWLRADYAVHGLTSPPETFPRQSNLAPGRFGNWMRLPGRHHSRQHWSRVWDGRRWLEGADAVAYLLALRGDAPALIPADLQATGMPSHTTPVRINTATVPLQGDEALARRIQAYMSRLPNLAEGEGRNNVGYGVAAWLVRDLALADDVALTWLGQWDARNNPPLGEDRLREIMSNARDYGRRPLGCGLQAPMVNGNCCEDVRKTGASECSIVLPQIICNARQLQDVTQDTLVAIQAANRPPRLFQRGDTLCRLRVDVTTDAPYFEILDDNALCGHLARVAAWIKVITKKGQTMNVDTFPPMRVVRDVGSLPNWELPALQGIVESPVFDRDGHLVATPGYHPGAMLWYRPSKGLNLAEVPSRPTTADIMLARSLLLTEFLGDFPFKDDASKAHTLAALLLPFVRQMIDGPTPLHLLDAPVEGTGKTLLATCITLVATGRVVECTSECTCDEEWRKRLTALLVEGPTYVLLDNLKRILDSGALASVLTSRTWKDRILGKSKTASLPNMCVWLASGNNTSLSRELIRRTIWVRLDAQVDAPWERNGFRHPNLFSWAKSNRSRLVWAALTLCQAWIAGGRPAGQQTLGMFERWAETLGGILDVANVPGFLSNANKFRLSAVDETSEWREFATAWWAKYQDRPVGVQELFDVAVREKLLDRVLGDKGERSQRTRLGQALRKHADRVLGKYRISCTDPDHKERQQYRLEEMPTPVQRPRSMTLDQNEDADVPF
jgi:hypothetical protein